MSDDFPATVARPTHDHLPDEAFFTPLDGAIRPEGAFNFEGPQGRYTLTWRQEAFARHYAACGNGAEAARRAGYSVRSARFIAHENLQNSKLRWRIRALAAQAEAQRRDETTWLLTMFNAALEMALVQRQPHAMIRALSQMARLSGLDRPPAQQPLQQPAQHPSWSDGEAEDEDTADAALALLPPPPGGILQQAILGPDRDDAAIDKPAQPPLPNIPLQAEKIHAAPPIPGDPQGGSFRRMIRQSAAGGSA